MCFLPVIRLRASELLFTEACVTLQYFTYFDILLTLRLTIILAINQLNTQNLVL